jgi:uncharacterized protein (UPF0332 family)
MKMDYERLLNDGKIEKVDKTEINLDSAEKDLDFAKKGLDTNNYNWVMSVAYETVLRMGNRLMNYLGYRAIGKEHHRNTFEFLKEINFDKELINYFNKIRKKRNDFIYRDIESVDKTEAEQIIKKAEEFVQKIRTFVQKIRT